MNQMHGTHKASSYVSHESYIQGIVEAAKQMVKDDPAKLAAIERCKVTYGQGIAGALGVTYHNTWKSKPADFIGPVQPSPIVEVCAQHQSDWTQVATTTIHELGHVVAGYGHGHDRVFKEACEALGLRAAKAVATKDESNLSRLHPKLRAMIAALPQPTDGTPMQVANRFGIVPRAKGCSAGAGTKGGKSRGVGSGSRLVKCSCERCGYTVRTTQKWLDVAIPKCPVDDINMTTE
jgi:hypothetical protein